MGVKVLAKRYISSKFQSCPIQLKLKIQSLLTLLIPKKRQFVNFGP